MGTKHSVYVCPVCGKKTKSMSRHCNTADTKNVEHVCFLQEQYVRANQLFDNMEYTGSRDLTVEEMLDNWGLYLSPRVVDEVWESNRTVDEFNARQVARFGRIQKRKLSTTPHVAPEGYVPLTISSYVDENGEWAPTAMPDHKPDALSKPSREAVYKCPACGERVQRFAVHLANRDDAAHQAFTAEQRELAARVFKDTEAMTEKDMRDNGLVLPLSFVKQVWIEVYGEQAVADRAQQLRNKHIARTLKNAHIHHSPERVKKFKEWSRTAKKWNHGLAEWTRHFFVDVAKQRFTSEELMKLAHVFDQKEVR